MHRKYELCLRLSSEEQAQLECDARRCGLSKTAYLRRLILGAEIKARPTQEIKDLRTEIHHIGNNINQIAHTVNGQKYAADSQIDHAVALVRRAWRLVKDSF